MKVLQIVFLIFTLYTVGKSQQSIGLEIRTSRNITYNSSRILGGGDAFRGYEVTRESNLTTSTYSFGLIYNINKASTFKLHIGRHKNGRSVGLTVYDDTFSYFNLEYVTVKYNYLQFLPSYTYNIRKGNFNVPIDVGFAINKRIKEFNIAYIGITEYNYDLRLSSGVQYNLNNFRIGSNIVYSKSIGNYANEYVGGEYKPYQIGVELEIGYIFNNEKANKITLK